MSALFEESELRSAASCSSVPLGAGDASSRGARGALGREGMCDQNAPCEERWVTENNGKESWDDYAVQFTIISQMNSWGDVEKGMQLAAALRGRARGVLTEMCAEERSNFDCLNKALRVHFGDSCDRNLSATKLLSIQRRPRESLRSLRHRIKTLARRGYGDVHREVGQLKARGSFMNAVDDKLKSYLYEKWPQDIDEALQLAMSFEDIPESISLKTNRTEGDC